MQTIREGFLEVGGGHQVYYQNCGKQEGIPVLFLHGGPGLGCSDRDKVFFDLTQTNLILFDQRGCGRSQPTGQLENNTTQDLLSDMVQLLDFFGVEKAILFGGSWGSTLALLFAIAYPERVKGLVLRGVFMATLEARAYFEKGGSQLFFPKAWARFAKQIPEEEKAKGMDYYFAQILSNAQGRREVLAYELVYYGMSVALKESKEEDIKSSLTHSDFVTKAMLLAHYSQHHFFIEEGYIWQHLDKIEHLPTQIIHGQYDSICLPRWAIQLAAQMKNAQLNLVDGGHIASDPAIQKELQLAMQKWYQ